MELLNGETLKCDKCKRVIIDTIVYLYIDGLENYVDTIRCEECYNQGGKN